MIRLHPNNLGLHWTQYRRLEEDVKTAQLVAVYLPPSPSNADLKKQFMSPAALRLKARTPMFALEGMAL